MKKALLILTLAAITLTTFAQSSKSKFHFGIKIQPALAWMRIDADSVKSDGLPFGFGYGLITDFGFAERYAFSTGIEVAYRGGKTKQTSVITGVENIISANYSLQFIEIPITLKLKTNEIGYMTYFFQVGFAPGFAIRTKADIDTVRGGVKTYSKKSVDVGDAINPFNISLLISAGAEYNLSGNTSLLFGLTFNNGFLDLLDDNGLKTANEKVNTVKGNSNYLALTVGILF